MTDAKVAELDKKIASLEAERQALLAESRKEALTTILATIARYGFTAVELGLGVSTPQTAKTKPVKAKLPPKYANPANPEKTWAGGKGATPLWVKDHIAKGGKLEDLLIK